MGADAQAKQDFMAYLVDSGTKEFGYGTTIRGEYEESLTQGPATGLLGKASRDGTGSAEYEDMRDLGKLSAFGQRRKAETATTNAVEATGHVLDAAGTFTAGGDFGATKATGKALKAASGLYKGTKSLVKRGMRVHKLRTAKNEAEYGGKSDRGVLWGAKAFFTGNLESQQGKAASSLAGGDARIAAGSQWNTDKAAHDAHLVAKKSYADDLRDYLADPANKTANKTEADFQTETGKTPPAAVNDPGAAPSLAGGKTAAGVKTSKALSGKDAAPLIKKLTRQCVRKADDLVRCLQADNEIVRKRAQRILHIIAETNLAGAIQKIKDDDLNTFYEVSKKMKTDAAYKTKHEKEFERRRDAIKEIVLKQLEGVGG